tara:strand:- start:36 stop:452 length:417 start_codon:yes stop_codon:yes gene_type:complete
MKKEWYLQQATDEKDPRPFWDSYVHHMCEVLETTDKKPFGIPIKDIVKKKKDRKYFLNEAEKLINGPRAKEYGDASLNHQRIADMWSVIFGIKVTVSMVYLAMIALKMSRIMNTPDHEDSWVDICGYGALGAEENNDK